MSDLGIVALVAVGTLAIRSSFVVGATARRMPPRVAEALRLVAPAVLGGLVAQTLLLDDGEIRGWDPWHGAAVAASLVALRTKSIPATLAAGMGAVWVLEAVIG